MNINNLTLKNKNYKNLIVVLSVILGLMTIFFIIAEKDQLIGTPIVSCGTIDEKNDLMLSGDEVNPDDNSTWGYSEWRAFIVKDRFGILEQELDETIRNDETFQHNLHILTIACWGRENGSLDEEELLTLTGELIHHTVALKNIEFPVTTDEALNIRFDLSVDNDILLFYHVYSIVIAFRSTDPSGKWYASDPTVVYTLLSLPPPLDWQDFNPIPGFPTVYPMSTWIATYSVENDLQIYLAAWVSVNLNVPLPLVTTQREVDLVDDDINPPFVILLEPPIPSDYPEVKPVITDADPYFLIQMFCVDYSGVQKITATLNVDGIIHQYFGTYIGSFTYGILISNPRDPGEYSVDVEVFDADLDRGTIDQLITSFTLLFDVVDDDDGYPTFSLDTGPPPNHQYYDSIKGIYTFPFSISASDEGSGIYQVTYKMGPYLFTKYYNEEEFPTEVSLQEELELPPGLYLLEVWVEDMDNDREGDSLISYENRTIDLLAPLTIISPSGPLYYDISSQIYFIGPTTELRLSGIELDPDSTDKIDPAGLHATYYKLDDEVEMTKYEDPLNFIGHSDGYHTIYFYSEDNAGNIEYTEKHFQFYLDRWGPELHIYYSFPKYYDDSINTMYVTSETYIWWQYWDLPGPGGERSGVKIFTYGIDEEVPIPYTGQVFNLNGYSEGLHKLRYTIIDNVGNGHSSSYWVFLDDIAPITEATIGSPKYIDETGKTFINRATQITLIASDFGSGVKYTYYSIDGADFIEYSGSFTMEGYLDGSHIIEFYSIDNLGNIEDPIKSIAVNIDDTPPNTEVSMDYYYEDDYGEIFVTGYTKFALIAEDLGSKVANVYYQIDDGPFNEYLEPFSLNGFTESSHVITFYSIDNLNNEESPPKSITVTIVSLEIKTSITDGELNPLSDFDVIFAKDKQDGVTGYKLVATNPGQIFYHIEIENTWPITIDTLTINLNLPNHFETQGSNPIHIYMDNVEITQLCLISETQITVTNIPSEGNMSIIIHIDYALKGKFYETIDEFNLLNYNFEVTLQCTAQDPTNPTETLFGMNFDCIDLIAHQKKTTALAGYIRDTEGKAMAGVIVQLKISDLIILETLTDENGFYWFAQLEEGDYEIRFLLNDIPISSWQSITIDKNILNWFNFLII